MTDDFRANGSATINLHDISKKRKTDGKHAPLDASSDDYKDFITQSNKFVRIDEMLEVAARQVAEKEQLFVTLQLWQHDYEKKEAPHGATTYNIEWMIPLYGEHKLENTLALSPSSREYFKIDAGTGIDCRLHFEPFCCGSRFPLEVAPAMPLQEGTGMVNKASPNELFIRDVNNTGGWKLKLEFDDTMVLSKVSFEHKSEEHPEITHYLFRRLVEEKKAELRRGWQFTFDDK